MLSLRDCQVWLLEPALITENDMKSRYLALAVLGTTALAACATEDEPIAPPPPTGVGAMMGTVAADRNGDGVADGYYTADGVYHAFQAPPCPPPPPAPAPTYTPPPTPAGERG